MLKRSDSPDNAAAEEHIKRVKNRSKVPKIAADLTSVKLPSLVPQPHGGALLSGGMPGHDGSNAGRPKDVIREKLRGIAAGKGIGFLSALLEGEIPVRFVGTCPHCTKESKPDVLELQMVVKSLEASIDARLKANEQALKYGVGTQNEQLSEDEGKQLITATVGKFFDLALAYGVPKETLDVWWEQVLKPLEGM